MILWLCTMAFSGPAEVALADMTPTAGRDLVRAQVIPHGGPALSSGYGPRGASVLLTRQHAGLPVDLSGAVWLRQDGSVRARRSLPDFPVRQHGDVISQAKAVQIAKGHVVAWTPSARLSWKLVNDELRRVWTISFERSSDPRFAAPAVQLDAETGHVIRLTGFANDIDPLAHVYPNNPAVDPEPIEVSLPLATEALSDARLDVRQCADQGELENETIRGVDWDFHVCTEVPAAGPLDGNYFYGPVLYPEEPGRDEDDFVAAQLYWSTHQGLDWFTELGWAPIPEFDPFLEVVGNERETDLLTVATASDPTASLYPYDNAYFTGGFEDYEGNWVNARMVFGQGSQIDYGYDTDVVYHELGHFIVRSTEGPSWSRDSKFGPRVDGGALNEGLADYFSSAIQGDPYLAEYAGGTDRDYIRTLEGDATCYADLLGEVHFDSQPFAQGLWTFRTSLLPDEARNLDQLVLDSLTVIGRPANFSDAYAVITEAVHEELGPDLADDLRSEWNRRGLPDCLPIQHVVSDAEEPAKIYTRVPYFSRFNNAGVIPGPLQFVVDAPEAGATITVRLDQRAFLGLDPLGTNTPVPPVIISKSGSEIHWEKVSHDQTFTTGGTEVSNTVIKWKHDAKKLGEMHEVGTRPHSRLPERYQMHEYELTFLAPEAGPQVFQFANHHEGYTLALYNIGVVVGPTGQLRGKSGEERRACGCATRSPGPLAGWAWMLLGLMGLRRR